MKNILTKLHIIMSKVDFIVKDKTNTFHGYDYASESAIKETLHKLLVEHKVLFTLSAQNLRRNDTLTDIDFEYGFYDIESGEVFKGTFVGTGEDKLDKGTYKAITGALKYILTSTFLIPTGDDPEKIPQKQIIKQTQPIKTYQKPTQTTTSAQIEYKPYQGDELKTGNKNGKQWYGIKHKNGNMAWLTKEQYEYYSKS